MTVMLLGLFEPGSIHKNTKWRLWTKNPMKFTRTVKQTTNNT